MRIQLAHFWLLIVDSWLLLTLIVHSLYQNKGLRGESILNSLFVANINLRRNGLLTNKMKRCFGECIHSAILFSIFITSIYYYQHISLFMLPQIKALMFLFQISNLSSDVLAMVLEKYHREGSKYILHISLFGQRWCQFLICILNNKNIIFFC